MEASDDGANTENMELGREHSATSIQTSDDDNQCVSEPGEWHQTVNDASKVDKETLFSFGNGGVNDMEADQYKTSTPIFSRTQETSEVQISSGASAFTMEDSVQGDVMSTPAQASRNYFSTPGSHPRLLQFSTGDLMKSDDLKAGGETDLSRESSQVEPDTSMAKSGTFYTPGADNSVAYFTASEDSTFVIDQTGDLPCKSNGSGLSEVHVHDAGELVKQESFVETNTEAQNSALQRYEGPEEDNLEWWVGSRPAEDVRLQRSNEVQLFESEQGPKGTVGDHEDLPRTGAHLAAKDDELRSPNLGESHDLKTSMKSVYEEASDRENLDLRILETICEEATNMTIKEALIHSLNPSVRAGLQDGKLLLNETEVLSLERYCETVIDNLITELLERKWSQGSESGIEEKKEKALQLSEVGLKALQKNCGRLAQNIISESIEDTNSLPICADASGDVTLEERVTTSQESVRTSTMQELLVLFQSSEGIQQYIGDLTAYVINSAMNKVAVSTTSGSVNKEMGQTINGDLTVEDTELARISGHIFDYQNKTQRPYRGAAADELQDLNSENSEASDSHHQPDGFDLALGTGELDLGATLEYDAEWDRGDMLEELHSFAPVGKQKIIVRELSFEEQTDVAKIDLLAPVFLAVTEDSDDDSDLKGLRRKAQSIENLCGVVEERVAPIRRCRSSSIPTSRKATRKLQRKKEEHETANQDSDSEQQDKNTGVDAEGGENRHQADLISDEQEEPPSAPNENGGDLRWYTVCVNSRNKVLDLSMLAPYMKVISHGGRFTGDRSTIVVIAACYLPQRSNKNYDYLMEQLFFYVISTLELLATDEEYYLVYFNAGTNQNRPTMTWMRRFYQQIERGLKKRMRAMYVVHPNFWLKTVTTFAKPFISSNFWRKLHFVHTLDSLSSFVPVEYIFIPDEVMRTDPDYRRVHNL